jgi:hypothetical protein
MSNTHELRAYTATARWIKIYAAPYFANPLRSAKLTSMDRAVAGERKDYRTRLSLCTTLRSDSRTGLDPPRLDEPAWITPGG